MWSVWDLIVVLPCFPHVLSYFLAVDTAQAAWVSRRHCQVRNKTLTFVTFAGNRSGCEDAPEGWQKRRRQRGCRLPLVAVPVNIDTDKLSFV